MWGNGVKIGIAIIATQPKQIQKVLRVVVAEWNVVAVGSYRIQCTVALRLVIHTTPKAAVPISGFVFVSPKNTFRAIPTIRNSE